MVCNLCQVDRGTTEKLQVADDLLMLCPQCCSHIRTECVEMLRKARRVVGTDDRAAVEAAAKKGYNS